MSRSHCQNHSCKMAPHKSTMKNGNTKYLPFSSLTILTILVILPVCLSDLNSEQQALLNFITRIPHGRKINWNSTIPICSSWVGITCNQNGTHVFSLRLPGVGLSGQIPVNTLGKLDAIEVISLRSNFLSGHLPSEIFSLPFLRYLYLQRNNFSGSIPSSRPPSLNFLDLSFNSFSGGIPSQIQNLTGLTGLNLANNSLSGSIPHFNLPKLKRLNLSYNQFNGSIPSPLQHFPASSFLGNSHLCGIPLSKCESFISPPLLSPPPKVGGQQNSKKRSPSTWVIIVASVGGTILLFLLALTFLVCCLRKRSRETSSETKGKAISSGRSEKPEDYRSGMQESEKNKLIFFEGCSYNFDLEDLLKASAEVLGKGSFGTAYKAILEEGTTVVVKRLKEVVVGKRDFEQQMGVMGQVGEHLNVVPLRAYYYSKDEKLLVHDYIPTGSLFALLHGDRGRGKGTLNWDTRLKICLGTSKGIAHIHSQGGGRFVHGNIKSSNVLLKEDLSACVSDFGLAPLMSLPVNRMIGYRSPEVVQTRKPTQKSDVYSFGVLLLEMLTGKDPLQPSGSENVADLPRWVHSIVREEWTAEVFDSELLKYDNVEEEMVQLLQIAMTCVAKEPDMRPIMDEVVRMIEEIRQSDSENRPSSEENNP